MPLAPLEPLGRSGVNPRGLLTNSIWQTDVTHYPVFDNLRYVCVVVDSCSALFISAVQCLPILMEDHSVFCDTQ